MWGLEEMHIHILLGSSIRLWRRFIDDILIVFLKGTWHLIQEALDKMGPQIRFTVERSGAGVVYCDLVVFKGRRFQETGRLDTDVYQKPINAYSYIPRSSDHPDAALRGFIKGELLRYVRICCLFIYFQHIRRLFFSRLRARGYPRQFLLPIFPSVQYSCRTEVLKERPKDTKPVPLVVVAEYSRHTRDLKLSQVMRRHWQLVTQADTKGVFEGVVPMVAYKLGRNLRAIISGMQRRARAKAARQ